MKAPKNRIKALRVDCSNCHATQDALQFACSQCHKQLYANVEADELRTASELVQEMETAIKALESPTTDKGNPYSPVDHAWSCYQKLKPFAFLPGMVAYLDRVLETLLPFKVRLLEKTVKANWLFWAVLLAFPLVTVLFRMHFSITGLLLLPAVAWIFVAYKATMDLRRTRERLLQIQSS